MEKPEYLEECFRLRKQGWSYNKLAARFRKDTSTIRNHCLKHGIKMGRNRICIPIDYDDKKILQSFSSFRTGNNKTIDKYNKQYSNYLLESLKRPAEREYMQRMHPELFKIYERKIQREERKQKNIGSSLGVSE